MPLVVYSVQRLALFVGALLVLFWVHDRSDDVRRTRALITRAVPLLDRLLRLTRIPGVRGVTNDAVALIHSIKP